MGIISNPSSFDRTDLPWRLSPRSAVLLWQTYVQIVDPTIKVLHIPTDEVVVFTAIHKPHSVTKDVLALVSAIYFASAIALEPHEALTVLGVDRLTALKCLKAQFHQRLAEADMLENPTLEVLQGLAIYLVRPLSPQLLYSQPSANTCALKSRYFGPTIMVEAYGL